MKYQRLALLSALLVTGFLRANTLPPQGQTAHVRTNTAVHSSNHLKSKKTQPVTYGLPNVVDSADLSVDFYWFVLTDCLPQTVQFIDNSVAINNAVIQEWQWDFGDGTTSTDQYPVHDYTENGSYTVKLTIKDTSGGAATYSQILMVNTPTPSVRLGNDTSICIGGTLILDAGVHPGCSYYWSTGATTRTIQVSSTNDYWVQVYNSVCAGSAIIHVDVKPLLSSAFTYSQLGTCLPVSVQFTDQSQACGDSIVWRQWEFGDGDTSSLANPLHIYTQGGTYTVKLSVRNGFGQVTTSSQSITINVNTPLVHLGNDTTICYGNTLTLDAGILGDNYLWGTGDTTRTVSVSQAGLYWVKVNKNGCSGWDSISVKTTFPLVADFRANITGQCLPVTVHFKDSSAIVCGSNPVTNWLWDFGDGDTSTAQNPDHIYTRAGKFVVQLTIRNAANMSTTSIHEINIVTIGPVPGLLPDVTICEGDKTQLNAGNEGSVFLWSPAGPLNNNTIQNPIATPYVTTSFIASISKCGVTINDTVIVYVDSIPRPVISQVEGGVLTCTSANTYKWYKNGDPIDGATNRSYRPVTIGYYQVEVTNARGCSNRSAKFFFLPGDGKLVPGVRAKIKLSPNPSHGLIDILFSKTPDKPVRVEIYNVFGKKVYQGYISNNINTINLGSLHKGQYFVELFVNDQKIVLPLQML